MTNIISIFSRDLAPTNGQVSGVVTEKELMRRQAALMPLREKLTAIFIEVMTMPLTREQVELAVKLNQVGIESLEEKIVKETIESLEILKSGFMPSFHKVA